MSAQPASFPQPLPAPSTSWWHRLRSFKRVRGIDWLLQKLDERAGVEPRIAGLSTRKRSISKAGGSAKHNSCYYSSARSTGSVLERLMI